HGLVYAFEPTGYAYAKLLKNIFLNPQLGKRIIPIQTFISDKSGSEHSLIAYSSWKVDGISQDAHPLHGGTKKDAKSIPAISIDEFCAIKKINRVDFIKIDTDGYEFQVLTGARKMIESCHPAIVFEIGLDINEQNTPFEKFWEYFSSLNYTLFDSRKKKKITLDNFHRHIPLRFATDIIAVPPLA
ncbi:MAG: FkbM family methyltransferase, partial [Pseudomonadota bacterium]